MHNIIVINEKKMFNIKVVIKIKIIHRYYQGWICGGKLKIHP